MTDEELLERVLGFWDEAANGAGPTEHLRAELVRLLFAYRARGMLEAAEVLRRARRGLAREAADPVGRFVFAQVEEELRRRAAGLPPRDDNAKWLYETPAG